MLPSMIFWYPKLHLSADGLGGCGGWLASLGASRKTLGPGAPNQLTASEAAEADLIWPMSPAPMGRGHMQSFNLLGQTVSESIGNKQQYRIRGTQIYM